MAFTTALFVVLLVIPAYSQEHCLAGCTVDADCQPDNDCNMCIKGICHAGCSGSCSKMADCGDSNCKYCTDGMCQNSPDHTCAQSCSMNSDCNGNSNCQLCFRGQCTAGCGGICSKTSDCVGECQHCISGVCAANNVTCNGKCLTTLDCIQSSQCNTCINGFCGASCGQPCSHNQECADSGCTFCDIKSGTVGTCGEFPINKRCGETCVVDDQCTGSPGTCKSCIRGKCGSACADPCIGNSDCVVTHCQNCQSGKCSAS